MTKQEVHSLEEYYQRIYGIPKDDNHAIDMLFGVYRKLFHLSEIPEADRQGIAEYYRILLAKDLPAYTWLLEVFHHVSKKNPSKHGFNYMVGILRQWMIHGFGHIPSQEEEELMGYFLERTKLPDASIDAKRIIKNLMGTYGLIKVTRMIGELEGQDVSKFFAQLLMERMKNKYELSVSAVIEPQQRATQEVSAANESFLIPVDQQPTKVREEKSNPPFTVGEVLQFKFKQESKDEQQQDLFERDDIRDSDAEAIKSEVAPPLSELAEKRNKSQQSEQNAKQAAIAVKKPPATVFNRSSPEYKEQLLKESIVVEDVIRNIGGPVRLTHIREKTGKEIHWGCNPHEKMGTLLKYNKNIHKYAKGVYALK